MSNLVYHARRELSLLGEDTNTIEGYLKVIQAFVDMNHSGGSASVAIPVLERLMRFKNLTPLTDDPAEWAKHSPEIWGDEHGVYQNYRDSEAFSTDGGKTYILLSEKIRDPQGRLHDGPIHESKKVRSE